MCVVDGIPDWYKRQFSSIRFYFIFVRGSSKSSCGSSVSFESYNWVKWPVTCLVKSFKFVGALQRHFILYKIQKSGAETIKFWSSQNTLSQLNIFQLFLPKNK